MPHFAISKVETIRRVKFIEANSEDQAWNDVNSGLGEDVWHRIIEEDYDDSIELTPDQFRNKIIPEGMK